MCRSLNWCPWLVALCTLAAAAPTLAQDAPQNAPIVLVGTVLTPNGSIDHGFVLVENGRISSVSTADPHRRDATVIYTNAVIAPGFVDLHNHISFDVFPRWHPGALFSNKYQWRTDPDYQQRVGMPYQHLVAQHFCDMNRWGELRALAGGTTSMLATGADACIHGIVRNLDNDSNGLHGPNQPERVFNTLELPPATDPQTRAFFAGQAQLVAASGAYDALVIHLAEGTDAVAHEEFAFVKAQSLLFSNGVFIHGTALDAADFHDMAAAGTALVWSPRSNLELYGQTTDVRAALAAGVQVAIAPDWGVTGSSNMLDELRLAKAWSDTHLNGLLSDGQLVEMVTSVPAQIAGLNHEIGAIAPGMRADIVVIDKNDRRDPYRAVISASARDVKLALIDGVPLYGARGVMRRFWRKSDLQDVPIAHAVKQLATPAANGVVVADVANRLQTALRAEGTSLAPLVEQDDDDSSLEDDDDASLSRASASQADRAANTAR
jgi:5-methylthioadenosine/S-adenosylhomocysteine deaminase